MNTVIIMSMLLTFLLGAVIGPFWCFRGFAA